jgi:hypothetical protein
MVAAVMPADVISCVALAAGGAGHGGNLREEDSELGGEEVLSMLADRGRVVGRRL